MRRKNFPSIPHEITFFELSAHVTPPDGWPETHGPAVQVPDGDPRMLQVSRLVGRRDHALLLSYDSGSLELSLAGLKLHRGSERDVDEERRFDEVLPHLEALTTTATEWIVHVDFHYSKEYQSLVELPVKFELGEIDEVRGFRFARTSDPEFSIIVEAPKDGALHHSVGFTSAGVLSRTHLRAVLDRAVEISRQFVAPQGS